jgi:hypothetical protein
MALVEYTGG